MPRRAKSLTIDQLRRQLAVKERQLTRILDRRRKLLARLEAIDKEILALGAKIPPAQRKKRRKAAKKPAAKVARGKGARKGRRGKPLAEYLVKILTGVEDGLRIKDIAPAVLRAGYETQSKDFYGIVAAALRDDARFKNLRRGVYALA